MVGPVDEKRSGLFGGRDCAPRLDVMEAEARLNQKIHEVTMKAIDLERKLRHEIREVEIRRLKCLAVAIVVVQGLVMLAIAWAGRHAH